MGQRDRGPHVTLKALLDEITPPLVWRAVGARGYGLALRLRFCRCAGATLA
jgi:hypothetical protein